MPSRVSTGGQIGRSLPRLEAREKVTGRAEYTHTMRLPGMLHGKIFRSTVAHGRIKSIDTGAAKKISGVHGVFTADDIRKVIPDPYYGPAFHDQPILAIDKVRFVGEPVAVVVASDPHVAEAAVHEIVAEYEELPAIYDEVEAMTSQVHVHEQLRPAGSFADLKHLGGRKATNIAVDARLRRGDVDKAFASAAHIFEHSFRTQKCLHLAFEPFASIADARDAERHHPHQLARPVIRPRRDRAAARLVGEPGPHQGAVPRRRLWLEALHQARGAGDSALVAHAAADQDRADDGGAILSDHQASQHAPHQDRRRQGWPHHGPQVRGVLERRRLRRRRPRVTHKSGFVAAGPYDIENVWTDSYALYTNMTPAGALRGFGIPQLAWAYESHTDMIARALELDPVEFRRRNLLREGRPQASGTILKDAPLEAVLDRLCDRLHWNAPFERGTGVVRRGRGLAIALKAAISPTTSVAMINVNADGSVTLYCGTVDMGQGSDTGMAQIVGEALNIPPEQVRVVPRDTDVTPYDMGTLGSRSLFHMGNATRLAAEEVRGKIAALAREVGEPEGSNISIAELLKKKYGMQAGNIIGTGAYKPDYMPAEHATGQSTNITPFWMIGGAGAEVEVDIETGHVRIARLVNVIDCGTPINPGIVETQISGAALMQLGFTMFERMHLDGGQVTNASLADYKIPGIFDVPAVMVNEAVDAYQHNGPFGAKGAGELATLCVSPAVANAIDDAVGVRLMELPLNPEAVLRGLRSKAGVPLDEG